MSFLIKRKQVIYMVKYELRQKDYAMRDKEPFPTMVTLIWVALTVFIIAGTFSLVLGIVGKYTGEGSDPLAKFFEYMGLFGYFIALVGTLVLYMLLKFIVTLLFCHSTAASSIHLKILEGTAMPVCLCREAFTFWQTLLIYCVPIAMIYSLILYLCIISGAGAVYMIILFFMGFYMAYDLTLVLYVLFYKIKDKMDYISIDHHVYYLTLYKKTYIKTNKKAKNQTPEPTV